MSASDPGVAPRARLIFGVLTAMENVRLGLEGPQTWRPENPGGPYLTTVLRLPQPVADGVHGKLEPLRHAAPGHYHYPASSLHVTLLNLDWMRTPDESAEDVAHRVVPLLAAAATNAPQLLFRIRGLRLTHHGVFANATESHPPSALAGLRRRVTAALTPVVAAKRRRVQLMEDLAFINVVRYGVRDLDPLRQAARLMRRHDFGSFRAETVELVLTDKVLSPSGTRVLAELLLGPTDH